MGIALHRSSAPSDRLVRGVVDAMRRGVADGFELVEFLDLTGVCGISPLIEGGVRLEQRLTRSDGRHHAPSWTERGAGPDVILLNGWTLSGNVWPEEFVAPLADSFHVVTPDNRGTGADRAAPTPFTVADLADDVAAVIDAATSSRPTLVGFSLGGMIAIEAALRYPERVGSLVLVSSRPPNPAQHRGRRRVGAALRSPDRSRDVAEQLVERWATVAGPDLARRHPERLREMAASVLAARTPWRTVYAQSRAAAGWSRPDRLRRLDLPTLVVHGLDDPLSPADNGRSLVESIPGAEWVEFAGAGHLLPQEEPSALAELVLDHVHALDH